MALNLYLIASGVLILGLAVFHSLLGEIYLVKRVLRRDNLPHLFGDASFTKFTIRYAWHLLTILCVATAAILFAASTQDGRTFAPVVWILVATFAAAGVWGIVATRGRHLSWVVLFLAAGLAAIGAT